MSEDRLKLLEQRAAKPAAPIDEPSGLKAKGEMHYDIGARELKLWNGSGWDVIKATEREPAEGPEQGEQGEQGIQGLPGADGADGAAGVDARSVSLIVDDPTIEYNTAGTVPTPASTTITASVVGAEGTPYFEFFLNDVSEGSPTTSNTYSYTAPSNYSSMPEKVEVELREDSDTGPILARDETTMTGLMAGTDAITIVLTNEAHALPVTSGGLVDYNGSGTSIEVWRGIDQVLYGSTANTYSVTAVGTSITPGTAYTDAPYTRVYQDHELMSADTASIVYTIEVRDVEGDAMTFTKTQTFAKSHQGATGDSINVDVAYNFQLADHEYVDASGSIENMNDGAVLTDSSWDYDVNWDLGGNLGSGASFDPIFEAPKDGIYFFSGEFYVVWTQNGNATNYPQCRIGWDVSTDGGSSWSLFGQRTEYSRYRGFSGDSTPAQVWIWPYIIKPLAENSLIRVRLICAGLVGNAQVYQGSEIAGHLVTPEYPN